MTTPQPHNFAVPSRSQARLVHIGFAAFTVGTVYSPAFDAETVRTLLQVGVIPGLGVSGGLLWALPGLRRAAARRKRAQAD